MTSFNRPVGPFPFLVEHFKSEIARLSKEQVAALSRATFVGMTEDETHAYEERLAKIGTLVEELAVLTS
jgi:hypothetical protein